MSTLDVTFECAFCPRSFTTRYGRAAHERPAHPNEFTAAHGAKRRQESLAAAKRKYREVHREELIAASRAAYWSDPEAFRAAAREWAAAHPERVREVRRASAARNRERIRLYRQRQRLTAGNRPKKYDPAKERALRERARARGTARAQYAVHQAVRTGRLVAEACVSCGARPTQAHHFRGYEPDHWLDVQWLCLDHHTEAHYPGTLALRERARREQARRLERISQTSIWGGA